jgi:hypothetical protein
MALITAQNILYQGPQNTVVVNGTAHFENFKQLFESQHLLLLRDIWWSK